MEIKMEVILDSGTADGCFSVRKQQYLELAGEKHYIGQPERRAFCPGQLAELREYAPELETMAAAIWTEEILVAWKEKQAALSAEAEEE